MTLVHAAVAKNTKNVVVDSFFYIECKASSFNYGDRKDNQ